MRMRGVVHEPGLHGTHVVVVPEEVERDEHAYGRRKPRKGQGRLDNLNCERDRQYTIRKRYKIRMLMQDSQKQNAPSERRMTASATKTGPAAPVIRSPTRSSHLKQRKTPLVKHRDIPAEFRDTREANHRKAQ